MLKLAVVLACFAGAVAQAPDLVNALASAQERTLGGALSAVNVLFEGASLPYRISANAPANVTVDAGVRERSGRARVVVPS